MVSTFYFSYDEEGHTFFEDTKSLMENTPRIEDCYVFVGDTTEEEIEEDWENYRELNVLEYLEQKKKEQEKPLIAGMDEIVEYIKTLEIKNKKLEEQNKELKETCEKQGEDMLELYKCKETIDKQNTHFDMICKTWFHPLRWRADRKGVGEYTEMVDKLYEEITEYQTKIKELEEKVDEGLKYKEQKELYEGRAKGMEEELNKIEKLVEIDDIPEPNQVFNAVKELKEFKEKADEECEASAVIEDMMGRVDKAEYDCEKYKEQYKQIDEYNDKILRQNTGLTRAIISNYDLEVPEGRNGDYDWNVRFRNFYNEIMMDNSEMEWLETLELFGIECCSWEQIKDTYMEDDVVRKNFLEDYLDDEDGEKENTIRMIMGDDEQKEDFWNTCEDSFIEYYINEYRDACEYFGSLDDEYFMLIR